VSYGFNLVLEPDNKKKRFLRITVYYIDRDGQKRAAQAKIGSNLLDVAIDNNIDLEGFG
jgi:hypothetical protein